MEADAEAVIDLWFRVLAGAEAPRREDLEPVLRAVAGGRCEHWLETPRGVLAYVLVLDQMTRGVRRGTPDEFAHDGQALRAALAAIDRGDHEKLPPVERQFLTMPLMHSEDLSVQDRCVALCQELLGSAPPELRARMAELVGQAEAHRDLIRRFGRFPHRNPILDRTSTAEEIEFLSDPDDVF